MFGHDISDPEHDERHTKVEELMWEIAVKVLKSGVDVILKHNKGSCGKCRKLPLCVSVFNLCGLSGSFRDIMTQAPQPA